MRGRKPIPTNVIEMRGNPGKKVLNKSEPVVQPITEIPEPPRKLKSEARKEWNRIVPFVISNCIVGQESLSLLATYCNLHEAIVHSEKKGELIPAAYISQYRSLAAEFGFTPSSRSRIKAGNAKEKDTETKRFFG